LIGNTFVYNIKHSGQVTLSVMNDIKIFENMVELVEFKQGDEVEVSDSDNQGYCGGYTYIAKYKNKHIVVDEDRITSTWKCCRAKHEDYCVLLSGIGKVIISHEDYQMLVKKYGGGE